MIFFFDSDHQFVPRSTHYPNRVLKMSVMDAGTLEAAVQFSHPCCLNFASHRRPGGGYESVKDLPMLIKTQEEDLFRRSNLPEIMDTPEVRAFYPLEEVQGFYVPEVVVSKGSRLEPIQPFTISLVTVPAVVDPQTDDQKELVHWKICRILEIAASGGCKDLILGAWGCGVFNNDPRMVARIFCSKLLLDFQGAFNNVVFAVPGEMSANHIIFKEEIESANDFSRQSG